MLLQGLGQKSGIMDWLKIANFEFISTGEMVCTISNSYYIFTSADILQLCYECNRKSQEFSEIVRELVFQRK